MQPIAKLKQFYHYKPKYALFPLPKTNVQTILKINIYCDG